MPRFNQNATTPIFILILFLLEFIGTSCTLAITSNLKVTTKSDTAILRPTCTSIIERKEWSQLSTYQKKKCNFLYTKLKTLINNYYFRCYGYKRVGSKAYPMAN